MSCFIWLLLSSRTSFLGLGLGIVHGSFPSPGPFFLFSLSLFFFKLHFVSPSVITVTLVDISLRTFSDSWLPFLTVCYSESFELFHESIKFNVLRNKRITVLFNSVLKLVFLIFLFTPLISWLLQLKISPVQFSSVAQSCPTLCDRMDCNTPGLSVHHQLPEFTQTHVHWVGDVI